LPGLALICDPPDESIVLNRDLQIFL
jgi:hypothetical protein